MECFDVSSMARQELINFLGKLMQFKDETIAVIGLGYVGLPLAVEFGRKRKVIGYDINEFRVSELKKGIDKTLETTHKELKDAVNLCYTSNLEDIQKCKILLLLFQHQLIKINNLIYHL